METTEAWPWELVWFRPVATLVIAATIPMVAKPAIRFAVGTAQSPAAWTPIRIAIALSGWVLGATALGPVLVHSSDRYPSHGFGLATVMLAMISTSRVPHASWAEAREDVRAAGWMVGAAAVAIPFAQLMPSPRWVWIGAAILLAGGFAEARRHRGALAKASRIHFVAGVAIAAVIVASLAAPFALSRIGRADAPGAGPVAATWRLRIVPWDATAMLASAWAASEAEQYPLALAQADAAHRLGAPESAVLELRAEIFAGRGRCDRARDLFDRSLEARARELFESDAPMTETLPLGDYRIPPALLEECGAIIDP